MKDRSPEAVERLVERLCQGDQEAARILVEEWGEALRYVIERKLGSQPRTVVDAADVEQDVWKSFLRRLHAGGLDRPEDLLAFLKGMARKKALQANRRAQRQKADAARTQSLEGPGAADGAPLASPQRGPEQLAMAQEDWERLVQGLPGHYRRALELLRDGYTQEQAADLLGIHPRSVQRAVALARVRLDEARQGS